MGRMEVNRKTDRYTDRWTDRKSCRKYEFHRGTLIERERVSTVDLLMKEACSVKE
jgi:hypothetical protein